MANWMQKLLEDLDEYDIDEYELDDRQEMIDEISNILYQDMSNREKAFAIVDIFDAYSGRFNEALNEARNPANDEVNDIIRKHLADGGSLTSEEKKVLNKYGINYNGRSREFSGTNKRFLTNSGKIGRGPKRGNNPSVTTWEPVDIDNHTYWPKHRGNTWEGNSAYDDFDYANYLTKESDPNARFYNMSKKEREDARKYEKEKDDAFPLRQLRHMPSYMRGTSQETRSMHKANHPYTPDYLDIKDDIERSQKHVKDANQYKDWAQNSLDQANQNMDDFRSRLPKNKR